MYFCASRFNFSCLAICFRAFSSGVFTLNKFKNQTFAILIPVLENKGALISGALTLFCFFISVFCTVFFGVSCFTTVTGSTFFVLTAGFG